MLQSEILDQVQALADGSISPEQFSASTSPMALATQIIEATAILKEQHAAQEQAAALNAPIVIQSLVPTPAPATAVAASKSSTKGGISIGVIIGAVGGVVVLGLLIGLLVYYFVYQKRSNAVGEFAEGSAGRGQHVPLTATP